MANLRTFRFHQVDLEMYHVRQSLDRFTYLPSPYLRITSREVIGSSTIPDCQSCQVYDKKAYGGKVMVDKQLLAPVIVG